ncbi:cytosolic phospholipase A2-like [Mytilus edulis]|uniref:cytosolic phospholipase A2-like n=1 Tax=Mytilus edulis TaxID=6550 RepID=UPI0039EE9FEF
MLLIDAGLAFNSPYPLVLHPSRKVDVILSFDFSHRGKDTNWPFKQLEKASKWAEEEEIPFPVIKKQLEEIKEKCFEKGDYEEVYVFPGENGAPSIVHFVMINKTYGHSGIKGTSLFKILPKYPTYKFHYSTEEFTDLLKLMFRNVMANNDKIIDCIESAILKKK